jgi:hypothetical protein
MENNPLTPAGAAPAPPPDAVMMQFLFGKMITFALGGVARLEIADHLTGEPKTAEALAASTSTHAPSLFRVLRMLASVGVFEHHPGERFALTPVGQLLRADAPQSLRNMIIMMTDDWSMTAWQQMAHCIRTGGDGVTAAFGKGAFDLFREIPEQAETFHRAMTDFTGIVVQALLQVADFSRFRRLADVAGGHGVMLGAILGKFPQLEGVLFDLPEVVAGAPAKGYLKGVEERVTIEGGSFFERVPSGCDAYIMKHIVHDWDDGSCRRILSLMRDALSVTAPESGRVFLFELVVPESPGAAPAKMLDMEMLVVTKGGTERTAAEFTELFASAGLRLRSITPTPSPMSLIEAELI